MNINDTIFFIKTIIIEFFDDLGVDSVIVQIERPVDFSYGDVSTSVALKYAKSLKISPSVLAKRIATYLSEKKNKDIERIEVVKPGFINIFFTKLFYKEVIKEILEKRSDFGKNESLKNQKWVVEHTSPNPNKAMHLGHLRNNLVGMGLVRLLSWNGASVVSDAVDNDRGIAIAKLMWGFLSHMKKNEDTPT